MSLLLKGIISHYKASTYKTSLSQACKEGNLPAVEAVLPMIRDINETSRGFQTISVSVPTTLQQSRSPLCIAVENYSVEIATILLNKGANANLWYWGFYATIHKNLTPLKSATMHNYLDMVRLLLDHGADPNMCTGSGETTLAIAFKGGYTQVAQLLEERRGTMKEDYKLRKPSTLLRYIENVIG
ncbi:ankyrin [Acephala macrosclerotiorum]|nr:ankyrin [Acephala macrosclerotiorum]